MAEYDANEQGDLQELEGGIEQNLSDSASAAKNIYNAQRKFRANHKNDVEEVSNNHDTSHQNNKLDKTFNANSPPQNKSPNGKSHSKANQKKSLRDKKSAESSAAKKSSSKLAQKKSKKAAEKSEETAKKGLRKLWSIISGIFGAMSVPAICILLVRFGRNDRTERADYAQTSILFAINDDRRAAADHAAGDECSAEK